MIFLGKSVPIPGWNAPPTDAARSSSAELSHGPLEDSVSQVIRAVFTAHPRNFVIAEVRNNVVVVAEERASTLARFPGDCNKKVVGVDFIQEAMLKEKEKAAAEARRKKAEAVRKKFGRNHLTPQNSQDGLAPDV
ncbi:unnamed protein product [Effrenium voratum]|nr:unnamed protein product [Effrenium voratum]